MLYGIGFFSLLQNLQIDSEAHTASCSVDTRDGFSGGKAAGQGS